MAIDNISKYIKSKKWFRVVKRQHSPFLHSFLRAGSSVKNGELEFNNIMKHNLLIGTSVYGVEAEFKSLKERMIKFMDEDEKFLDRYFHQIKKDIGEYDAAIKNIKKQKFKNLKDFELKHIFQKYISETIKIVSHLWPILAIEDYLLKIVEENLAEYIDPKNKRGEFNRVRQKMLTSAESASTQKKEMVILSLASKLKNNGISKSLNEIKKNYNNLRWVEEHEMSFKEGDFNKFLKIIEKKSKNNPGKELEILRKNFFDLKREKIELIKKYHFNKKIVRLFERASELPVIRFSRLEIIIKEAYELKDNFFKEICRRLKIDNITRYYYWEIIARLIKLSTGIRISRKRNSDGGFIVIGSKIITLSNYEAVLLEKYLGKNKSIAVVIKGSIANLGFAKGKVKIITSINNIGALKMGEILVTHMTTPEYVPAMKKSAAIVTDEGGISCHAAIISRELGKPCIIGTKIATKVLKDGDLVEVDANRGIVKIIK